MTSKGALLKRVIEDPNASSASKSEALVKLVSAYNASETADAIIADQNKEIAALRFVNSCCDSIVSVLNKG